jgi:GNAT superfamily N-acetyltransferase
MNARTIAPVRPGEQPRCIGTLVSAFADDPVARWVFSEPGRYLDYFPRVLQSFAAVALRDGTAWEVDGFSGTAVWLAPGQEPDEEGLASAVAEGVPGARQAEVFELLEQMAESHPRGPHWYLPFIGVEPARQGRGCGSALLSRMTRVCDQEGLPAYLEATRPANVALYRRHGFRPLGVLQAGDSPPLVRMERNPRLA